jgi:hypothetical protein
MTYTKIQTRPQEFTNWTVILNVRCQQYSWDKHHNHRVKKMPDIDSMTCFMTNSTTDISLNFLLRILLMCIIVKKEYSIVSLTKYK